MVTSFVEVEVKFTVDEGTPVPDLGSLPGISVIQGPQVHELSALYFDTADLRLTRAKMTLRRRTGGKDDGWHLKLPARDGRLELSAELTEAVDGCYRVPASLLAHVASIVDGRELRPIARVDNTRTEFLLGDSRGQVAEFCDDLVNATSLLPGGSTTRWREWELELAGEFPGTGAGRSFLAAATEVLTGTGVRLSASPSKLVAALGDSLPADND